MVRGPEPVLHIRLSYEVRPFEDVERQYLELFQKYQGMNT